ncbi:beta-N-acetylhexosaminidase [Sanguibacter sp. HDW7]|uniref:beta-N-acetylhexosaminidase n=1 Tax=Sanguibacter sp. HDW7 TaxID=2714931 RepID=UPI001409D29E|nr:beta-N-acetylhexosaminidase [Sanguibacter sp. HDW7]QIK84736.1 beta-N-acetylhexosaminidase [Sanguibacter sp. HDW7]
MTGSAASRSLLPLPRSVAAGQGTVALHDGSRMHVAPQLRPAARAWARDAAEAHGVDLVLTDEVDAPVVLEIDPVLPAGGYTLTTRRTGTRVRIGAGDLAGAFAAVQTLRQLAGPDGFRRGPVRNAGRIELPVIQVEDAPRFAWRGILLDVARHFLPKADVLRFIDLAAAHHLNVLHLHLTDDQGWRVEIDAFPRLTEVGSWRPTTQVGSWRFPNLDGRPHGGFYTKDDLREIVAYARARGVEVMPEIDVPGHVEAAIAAYPELGVSKKPHQVRTTWGISTQVLDPSEASLDFFRTVVDELVEVFDGPWFGIGGDEVPPHLWLDAPHVVAQAEALGLGSVAELHGWFLGRLAEHVLARGRRPVVWDEGVTEHLPQQAIVTSWRGFAAGVRATQAGHDVVMAPEQVVYLDHRASEREDEPVPVGFARTLEDVYAFEPLPDDVLARTGPVGPGRVLGVQACLWSEYLHDARRRDYAAFPRLAAFAEVAWSPATDRSLGSAAQDEFRARLVDAHLPRLAAAGVEHRPLDGPLPWQQLPGLPGWPIDLAATLAAAGPEGHVGGWHEGNEHGDAGLAAAPADGTPE